MWGYGWNGMASGRREVERRVHYVEAGVSSGGMWWRREGLCRCGVRCV